MSDADWMRQALILAEKAAALGEVPVGAILVNAQNEWIGRGFNRVIQMADPTAHAEIRAIRSGARHTKNYRLTNTTLYVTLEPCAMCAGALIHARIKRLVFGARDFKTGAAGSLCNLFHPTLSNHAIQIDEGVLQAPCSALLRNFFEKKRAV